MPSSFLLQSAGRCFCLENVPFQSERNPLPLTSKSALQSHLLGRAVPVHLCEAPLPSLCHIILFISSSKGAYYTLQLSHVFAC